MYKVSDTGWLCYREKPSDNWIPLFALTLEQQRAWIDFHKTHVWRE